MEPYRREAPIAARSFDDLLAETVAFHGHLCPGQVLGVRMTLAGCRELGLDAPRSAGKRLVVFVEIDRCGTDAIQALTGVSLGKRTLKHVDYGKMAATFVDTSRDTAVRISARDDSRDRVREWAPGVHEGRQAQIAAYRVMPEPLLLGIEPVRINTGWLDRQRVRVLCDRCGEGVNYQREVVSGGSILCRACSGEPYYVPATARPHRALAPGERDSR